MNIGISGARGSFSEEAARSYSAQIGDISSDIAYLIGVEQVLSALERGSIERGIFPIENSNGGIVIEAVHAMAAHVFRIERLFNIEVHHNLLVVPGTKTSDITAIASHDQAIKQCRMYLKRAWANVELREYADTAQAAHDLHEGLLSATTAVIAPATCAELYNLEIIEPSIQDLKFNLTTFIAAETQT